MDLKEMVTNLQDRDDMEEYRRWEDNIKMDLKEMGVYVRSLIDSLRIGIIVEPL